MINRLFRPSGCRLTAGNHNQPSGRHVWLLNHSTTTSLGHQVVIGDVLAQGRKPTAAPPAFPARCAWRVSCSAAGRRAAGACAVVAGCRLGQQWTVPRRCAMEAAAPPAPPTARCCYSCTLTLQLTLCIRCGKSYHHLCAGAEGNDDMNVCGRNAVWVMLHLSQCGRRCFRRGSAGGCAAASAAHGRAARGRITRCETNSIINQPHRNRLRAAPRG